jgi:hypothetical protein
MESTRVLLSEVDRERDSRLMSRIIGKHFVRAPPAPMNFGRLALLNQVGPFVEKRAKLDYSRGTVIGRAGQGRRRLGSTGRCVRRR